MAKQLTEAFAAADKRGRAAFVGFVTAGYPTREQTVDIMLGMQKGGTDIIELGVPFTDPMADGASIQKTSEVALAGDNPISLADCLALTKAARAAGLTVPVILMGYYNPFLMYGLDKLMDESVASGVNARKTRTDGTARYFIADIEEMSISTNRMSAGIHVMRTACVILSFKPSLSWPGASTSATNSAITMVSAF